MNALANKLRLKPGYRMLLMNAPDDYAARLQPLPAGSVAAVSPPFRLRHS